MPETIHDGDDTSQEFSLEDYTEDQIQKAKEFASIGGNGFGSGDLEYYLNLFYPRGKESIQPPPQPEEPPVNHQQYDEEEPWEPPEEAEPPPEEAEPPTAAEVVEEAVRAARAAAKRNPVTAKQFQQATKLQVGSEIFEMGLTKTQLVIWFYLSKCADMTTKDCYPSITKISEKCKCRRMAAVEGVRVLEEKKIIRSVRQQRKPTTYIMRPAEDWSNLEIIP